MKINGLQLPRSLVLATTTGRLRRNMGSWPIRQEHDSYGNRLETELGQAFDFPQMATETAKLPADFPAELVTGEWPRENIGPGAIPDITDFSMIVCFAIAGGGEVFCLDYRESIKKPSVIYWDDCYWRKLSPDLEAFLELFDLRPT